jgi:hypothetical protein
MISLVGGLGFSKREKDGFEGSSLIYDFMSKVVMDSMSMNINHHHRYICVCVCVCVCV